METSLFNPPAAVLVPDSVQAIFDTWDDLVRLAADYHKRFCAMCETELKRRGTPEISYKILSTYDGEIDCRGMYERAHLALVMEGKKTFSPPGGMLEFTEGEMQAGRWTVEGRYDGRAFWAHLTKAYGGGTGVRLGREQMAAKLGRAFTLQRNEQPRIIAGRVVLPTGVSPGFSSYCRDHIIGILDGLASAAAWSNAWKAEEAEAAKALRNQLSRSHGVDFDTSRLLLGSSIMVVMFKSKWEFRLSPEFAEKVQLFLAEFNGFSSAG